MGFNDALSRLSHTNSPDEDDIRLVSSSLAKISAELGHEEAVIKRVSSELVDAQAVVAKLQSILDAVVRKHDKLKDTLSTSRRLLSGVSAPARRIPVEIMQQIFCAALDPFPVLHYSSPPLSLGQVCRYWREVAHVTAELWSSIHVVVPTTPMGQSSEDTLISRGRSLMELASAWLERAGRRPLKISIFSKPFPGSALMDFLADFIIHLSIHFKQCTYLRIAAPFECLNFLPALEPDFPAALETVILSYTRMPVVFNTPVVNPEAIPILLRGPRLRNLSLSSIPDIEFRPTTDWGRLHTLALHVNSDETFGPAEALNILLECSRLQSFTLNLSCKTWRWVDTIVWAMPLTLPFLTTLTIRSFFPFFCNSVFTRIAVPNIRKLVLAIGRSTDEDETCNFLNGLRQLLQPSSELEVLSVSAKNCPDNIMGPRLSQSIRSFLGAISSVSNLTLDLGSKMVHEEFLSALKVDYPLHRHGALCANLSEMAFPDANDSIGRPADSVLEGFVLSRLSPHEPIVPLRRFTSSFQLSSSCMKALGDSDCMLAIGGSRSSSDKIMSVKHLNSPFVAVPSSVEIVDTIHLEEEDHRVQANTTHG